MYVTLFTSNKIRIKHQLHFQLPLLKQPKTMFLSEPFDKIEENLQLYY